MNKKDKNQTDKNAPKKAEKEKQEVKTEELEQKVKEMENNWKRALADYKNLQRRTLKEKEEAVKFSNFVLISELIPVYDNLEMVQKHSEDEGLKMVVSQFWEVLKGSGVEKVETEGKEFDENTMEAVETEEGEKNKVLEILQQGYKFKNRLVKPAKVVVGKEKEDSKEESPN